MKTLIIVALCAWLLAFILPYAVKGIKNWRAKKNE